MNQLPVAAAIDRLAQAADMHIDQIALGIEVQIPYTLEQHGACHNLPRATHQEFEHLQLPRGQLDLTAAPRDTPGKQLKIQVRHLELRGIRTAGATAGERLDAGEQ